MIEPIFTFFNMKKDMGFFTQASELDQTSFENRPEPFYSVHMDNASDEFVLSMKHFRVTLKALF